MGRVCKQKGMDRGLPSSFLTHAIKHILYALDSGVEKKE